MEGQCQSWDRISFLPQDAIEKILTYMPIRDAIRTSILSKKWRYCWTGIPKLVFDDGEMMVNRSSKSEEIGINKFFNAIFHVLLLHRAPILEFSLSVNYIEIASEIDLIINHLSRSNSIKKFIFKILVTESYLLPSSFFSLQTLEHLDLSYCYFELPLMNKGFSMLKSLHFNEVFATNEMILGFLTNCPLLETFTWIEEHDHIELTERELVELFKCLPSVQVLEINLYIKHLGVGGMPHKLPNPAAHLRVLILNVCYLELASVLCVINSSPNLEKIDLELCWIHRCCRQKTCKNLLDHQDYSGLKLDHLIELEITEFHNYAPEMEFVKLIMAKSPVLERARIELSKSVSVDKENKMLRDLVLLPFPRASPTANFIIEDK